MPLMRQKSGATTQRAKGRNCSLLIKHHLISVSYAGPIDCPLQTYAPEGEPLHSIVEEFADDQNAWLRDFLPVLEKITYLSDH